MFLWSCDRGLAKISDYSVRWAQQYRKFQGSVEITRWNFSSELKNPIKILGSIRSILGKFIKKHTALEKLFKEFKVLGYEKVTHLSIGTGVACDTFVLYLDRINR